MIGLDRYDIGLAKLLAKLDNRRPEYLLVLSYESQLQEIKGFLTQFGDTESLRSERARIIYQLNKIAVEITGASFNALCAQESVSGLTLDSYLEEVVEQYTHELLDEQYKPLGLRADETTDFQSKLGPQLLEIKLTERFVQGSVYRNIGVAGATVTIESVLQAQSRFVLTGDPGAGKTTTLKRLAIYLAQQSLQDEEFGSIPIYVPLILTSVYNLEDLIRHQVKILGLDIPSGEIETFFKNEKIVLLLDGLNEVPFDTYRKCRDAINGLAGYRHCKLIVSDRPSYDQSLVGFPVFELEKWNADAIQQYVRQAIDLLGKKRSPGALLDRIDHDPSLYAIVNNPLLLGLLTTVYYEEGQIPLLRAELLSRFVQVLLERDRQKGINEPVSENILKQLLAQLAFAAYQAEKKSLSEQFVCDQLAYQLRNLDDRRFIGNLNAEIVLQRLLRGNWLQKSSEGQYRFNFDILQEWFVAYELAGRWEKQEPFNEWICNPHLEGSIAQISGLLEPISADAFVNQVLELGGIRLAAQCAISLPPTSPVRQNVIAQLRHQLFSKNEAMRVAASKLFIFLNDISVQEDLIQLIMHDSGAVCWNAALALQRTIDGQIATLTDAHPSDDLFIKILNQSHYNEDVQVTACIALGRSKTKRAISALIQALEKSERVRRYAAISLGRMNDITAIGLLERAAQDASIPKVQAGALRALQIARPQRAQSLADQMRYVSNAIVKQEVDVILGIGGDEKTITTYIHQLERGNEVRQKKAIQFLGSVRAVRAVEPLWKLLDQDTFQDSTARGSGRSAARKSLYWLPKRCVIKIATSERQR